MPNEKGVLRTQLQPPKDRRTVITFKHNKKLKMMHVGHTYGPKVLLFDHCKHSVGSWAKTFYLKTIRTGIKKQVSNNTSI